MCKTLHREVMCLSWSCYSGYVLFEANTRCLNAYEWVQKSSGEQNHLLCVTLARPLPISPSQNSKCHPPARGMQWFSTNDNERSHLANIHNAWGGTRLHSEIWRWHFAKIYVWLDALALYNAELQDECSTMNNHTFSFAFPICDSE